MAIYAVYRRAGGHAVHSSIGALNALNAARTAPHARQLGRIDATPQFLYAYFACDAFLKWASGYAWGGHDARYAPMGLVASLHISRARARADAVQSEFTEWKRPRMQAFRQRAQNVWAQRVDREALLLWAAAPVSFGHVPGHIVRVQCRGGNSREEYGW